jgi:hypothetical protein
MAGMNNLNRRQVLRGGLGAAAALATRGFTSAAGLATESARPGPCRPSAWKKHGIVLAPSEPWEGDHIQNFTSPVEPLEDGRWRLWYSACEGRYRLAYAEGRVGERFRKVAVECTPGRAGQGEFVVGHLPEGWKPVQVVHMRLRSGRHRIYFWAHGKAIARYLAAESEDGKRYTVVDPLRPVLYHPNDRACFGVPSPDGVQLLKKPASRPADEPAAAPRLISNDSTMVYQLADGTFEMYSVALVQVPATDPAYVAEDNAPGLLRVIDRYASADGLHFEQRRRVIQRDSGDAVDQQFYHLSVTHTPRGRIGMLGNYRCRAQTMDLEWCHSADGLTWERSRLAAWLPRGAKGEADSYGIYPPAGLVFRDAKCHLFYTGVNTAHNGKDSDGPPRTVIMYATTDSPWA